MFDFEEENNFKKYKFIIDQDKYKDLIELTEEREFSKIIEKALTIYYAILKYQTTQHKLALMPVNDNDEFDSSRPIVFLVDSIGIREDE